MIFEDQGSLDPSRLLDILETGLFSVGIIDFIRVQLPLLGHRVDHLTVWRAVLALTQLLMLVADSFRSCLIRLIIHDNLLPAHHFLEISLDLLVFLVEFGIRRVDGRFNHRFLDLHGCTARRDRERWLQLEVLKEQPVLAESSD